MRNNQKYCIYLLWKYQKANLWICPPQSKTKTPPEGGKNDECDMSISSFLSLLLYECCMSVYINRKWGKINQLQWVISSLIESSQISFIKIFSTCQTPDTLKTINISQMNRWTLSLLDQIYFMLTLLAHWNIVQVSISNFRVNAINSEFSIPSTRLSLLSLIRSARVLYMWEQCFKRLM